MLAIVSQAVWRIGKRALKNWFLIGIAAAAFIALFVFNVAFPIVIAVAGLAGHLAGRSRPGLFTANADDGADSGAAPLIADDALRGERPSVGRAGRILVIGLILWAAPVVAAAMVLGGDHVFVDQGLFFSGTAVVTFGGAYAVLSFVAQRAVEVYGWLQPGEMVNGLAVRRVPRRLPQPRRPRPLVALLTEPRARPGTS